MDDQEINWFDSNIHAIEEELTWLRRVITARMADALRPSPSLFPLYQIAPPDLSKNPGPYSHFVLGNDLNEAERLAIALVIATHILPEALDELNPSRNNSPFQLTEVGGATSQTHQGFVPTLQTLIFLAAGHDLKSRVFYGQGLFQGNHPMFSLGHVRLERTHPNEPRSTSILVPSAELISLLTTGDPGEPEFGTSFPAQKIETSREWDSLVLPRETKDDIMDIVAWMEHEHRVMEEWELGEKLSPGFRCLFHGPPGTGKTFTAQLLGKATGREVYRIDLSMVVSKYIGETEKNLKAVFDKAQSRGWILFFDEADSLFGKRTDVSDSKDRYANQEVSYLLQRVENFDGVVILATNNRDNMDKAFTRRFQVVVNFPMPSAKERLRLWETGLPSACTLGPLVNLPAVAEKYELSGGSIMNVVRHCALRASMRGKPQIEDHDLLDGIRREYRKAGRLIT